MDLALDLTDYLLIESDQYQLVDFGDGKKLERFSGVHVLRDCPAAEGIWPHQPASFDARPILSYCRDGKKWKGTNLVTDGWSVRHGKVELGLKPTPFGHLGAFCEQATNWSWLDSLGSQLQDTKAINLFAYTGGTTLKLASLGASVVHVDSAKNIVGWARENAERSRLTNCPVRWIVDDAMTFVRREIKRGNKYDIIVADPPAFGHGGRRASWKIERDLEVLIQRLAEISSDKPQLILISWHSHGVDAVKLFHWIDKSFGLNASIQDVTGDMDLISRDGRRLNCGHYFRWHVSES